MARWEMNWSWDDFLQLKMWDGNQNRQKSGTDETFQFKLLTEFLRNVSTKFVRKRQFAPIAVSRQHQGANDFIWSKNISPFSFLCLVLIFLKSLPALHFGMLLPGHQLTFGRHWFDIGWHWTLVWMTKAHFKELPHIWIV